MLSATGAIASIIYKIAVFGVTLSEKKNEERKKKKGVCGDSVGTIPRCSRQLFPIRFLSFFLFLSYKSCTGHRTRRRSRASRTGVGTGTGTTADRSTAHGLHHQLRLGEILDPWVSASFIQLLLKPPARLEQRRQLQTAGSSVTYIERDEDPKFRDVRRADCITKRDRVEKKNAFLARTLLHSLHFSRIFLPWDPFLETEQAARPS